MAAVNYADVYSFLCVLICQWYVLIHNLSLNMTLHVPFILQERSIYILKVRIFMNAALWLTNQKLVK